MSFYADMQGVATEILTEFNQGVIRYMHNVPATSGTIDDPGEPIFQPYVLAAAARGVSFKFVQSGLALATDLQITAAVPADVVPDARGFIEMDGVQYKIVLIKQNPPAGVPVAYIFVIRK